MIHCRSLQWGAAGQPLTPPLDLDLSAGSLTAIIGHNGCGKSSLLKVIAGLQKPLAGRLQVNAQGLGSVAYLQQQQSIDRQFPLRLQQLVSAGLWRSTLSRQVQRQRLQQALTDWHLSELAERPLQALSGGELQRALLARLNLTGATLLLLDEPEAALDEPEAALDEQSQQLFWQHIERWQAAGRTVLLVSHNLNNLNQRIDNALLVSPSGCIFAPLRQVLSQRSALEQVA